MRCFNTVFREQVPLFTRKSIFLSPSEAWDGLKEIGEEVFVGSHPMSAGMGTDVFLRFNEN